VNSAENCVSMMAAVPGLRLLVDTLIALMLTALLGGLIWHHRYQEDQIQARQTVHRSLAQLIRTRFDAVRVRQALTMAIDKDFVAERATLGAFQRADGPIHSSTGWAYAPDALTIYPHVYSKLAYDAAADFVPVSPVVAAMCAFAVSSAVPASVRSLKGYMDWGRKAAQPIFFHHGWPLSSDDWDAQMLYFLGKGYRVIAHDRRGHGRSSQVSDGHDMDHYAADVAAVVDQLDLRNAIHIGHSTGGGEAARYVARHGNGRVAKLVLIGAVPPLMLKTAANPGGLPIEVFDGLRNKLTASRTQFYLDFASGPFYGYNRPGSKPSQAVIWNWWRQGMMGSVKAHYDCIKAFSETDFSEDLKSFSVPTLVMHGDDDQIVPIADSALLSAKLLKSSTLKIYEKLPHGMCTTHADTVNTELHSFVAA
jgi:non-heme chloroperoxidase